MFSIQSCQRRFFQRRVQQEIQRPGTLTKFIIRAGQVQQIQTQALQVSEPKLAERPDLEIKKGDDIREAFLRFFEDKGHARIPSASLVPDDPTVLLTIAGMLQFKRIFLGQQAIPKNPRATSSQKCVRTNDIENVGVTKRHHTFFEMLGNFSFGDYFKLEAIQWSWELSTKVLGIPEERIWVSVFETDDEAYNIWKDKVGIPEERIVRMGEKDNFWASGPTGPCGPCSELYYDFYPSKGVSEADLDDDSRFIEFYNLVFMELQRNSDGTLTPLTNKNIDTGMGLERVAQILQGVPNNYETDLIFPLVQAAARAANIDYHSTSEAWKTSLKVIGDHVRAVTFMLSDGVIPSNTGRGYVLRRLIRRVVIKGKLLGIQQPFIKQVAEVAVQLSCACDPYVQENSARIYTELCREEERFRSTIEAGQKLLAEIIATSKASGVIPGQDAFSLYDTFGFPLEITQELAEVENLTVDVEGFLQAMTVQRERSQAANADVDLTLETTERQELNKLAQELGGTRFVGYDELNCEATIQAILFNGSRKDIVSNDSTGALTVQIALNQTPFYAESGGQVSDLGTISPVGSSLQNGTGEYGIQAKVISSSKIPVGEQQGGELVLHKCQLTEGSQLRIGEKVKLQVDKSLRRRAMCNHSATHLLQSALKIVLGDQTAQQGSLVSFDKLRFDFNLPRGMERAELTAVEKLVNSWIQQGHQLETTTMSLNEAKAAGAIAMFGEKYEDVVRVVNVPNVSMELCGGTHVSNTADIGGFKIIQEAGIASGIRRIEAVAGPCVMDYLDSIDGVVRDLQDTFRSRPDQIQERVKALQEELKSTLKENQEIKQQLAMARVQALLSKVQKVRGFDVLISKVDSMDGNSLQTAAQHLQEQMGEAAAVILASTPKNKVAIAVAFGSQIVEKGLEAGNFVGTVAKICGGGGGGRVTLAQAGGKDPSKLDDALQYAMSELLKNLS